MVRRPIALLNGVFSRMRPEAIVLLSFATATVLGTILLWLPVSHTGEVGLSEALFTATSAVCVTGLVVVDTGSQFTLFGQIVILALIELGGLGVMTFAALAFDLLGRRLLLSSQEAMTTALVHEGMADAFRKHFHRMLRLLIGVEVAGAALLFIGLAPVHGLARGAYSALFHSVSAFCNAGFSLYADSLIGLRGNALVMTTVATLIVIGGIGYPVLFDLVRSYTHRRREWLGFWGRLEVHTRIALSMTMVLLVVGSALLCLLGLGDGQGDVAGAVFQSVTARTAGFNTVPIGAQPVAVLLVLVVLMFIGGSPGSCAGGVKTTTFALWLSQLWCRLRGKTEVVLQRRYIPQPLVRRSSTIVGLAVIWNVIGVLMLSVTEADTAGMALHDMLFEQISAFGTVGLSTGVTSRLSEWGRLWIVLTMFVGRTGPLTGALLLLRRRPRGVRFPEGKVMIG